MTAFSLLSISLYILHHFHLGCLRELVSIKLLDKITHVEVLLWDDITSIDTLVCRAQMRWTDNIVDRTCQRLAKKIFCGELVSGRRALSGPKKWCKDNLKISMNNCDIDFDNWVKIAHDHYLWHRLVSVGIAKKEAIQKLTIDKAKAVLLPSDDQSTVFRTHCNICFQARFDLQKHFATNR